MKTTKKLFNFQRLVRHFLGNARGRRFLERVYNCNLLTDKQYLSLVYMLENEDRIDWKNPRSFREKLQWRKLYDRNPLYTDLVDKVKFKQWAAGIIGDEYIIPTLAVWDRPEDIDFSVLPSRFVLKCNHNSGNNYIHSDDSVPDAERIRGIMKQNYEYNYFKHAGEWPYKNVERKVLAEQFLSDGEEEWMPDYKFYCFHGKPLYVQINSFGRHYHMSDNRAVKSYQAFYDMEWNKQEFIHGYPYENDVYTEKPANFEKMIELAAKLSKEIPFVRVDFYNLKGKIYVGEMTFFPYAGFKGLTPEKWDYYFGDLIKL